MIDLGFLEEVEDLRLVWKNEAQDFTPWLSKPNNMQLLGDAIGLDIETEDVESPVGDFSLDILAEEVGTGRKIIIENQLESTNHDHLGKLITYAAGKQSQIVIWIVKQAREEHKAAIEWLNGISSDDIGFFLCEIKLYKIGDSQIAPKFEVVEKPNDWAKQQKQYLSDSKEKTITQLHRNKYWREFGEFLQSKPEYKKIFRRKNFDVYDGWLGFGLGTSNYWLALFYREPSGYFGFDVSWNGKRDKIILEQQENIVELFDGESIEWSFSQNTGNKHGKFVIRKYFSNVKSKEDQFVWLFSMMLKCKHMVDNILNYDV